MADWSPFSASRARRPLRKVPASPPLSEARSLRQPCTLGTKQVGCPHETHMKAGDS